MAYCPKCGAVNDDDNRFCMYCGAGMEAVPAAAAPITPEPVPSSQDSGYYRSEDYSFDRAGNTNYSSSSAASDSSYDRGYQPVDYSAYVPGGGQSGSGAYQPAPYSPAPGGTDGLCLAGFIVSIANFFICGGAAIVGLILSIIGVVRVKKSGRGGKGLGIAGIIISGIQVALVVIFLFMYVVMGINSIGSDFSYGNNRRRNSDRVSRHNASVQRHLDEEEEDNDD